MKKGTIPQSRRHVLIYDEDWKFLCQAFGPGSPKPIGPGPAIRALIHGYVARIKASTAATAEKESAL